MDTQLKQRLERCDTMEQMLNLLHQHYDLTAKIGPGSKAVIVANLPKVLQLAGARPK